MLIKELIYNVELPEGVTFSVNNHEAKLSGPRGDLSRIFKHSMISLSENNGNIKLVGKKLRRKEKAPNLVCMLSWLKKSINWTI